ncbi:sigma-54 interaction domain-containing protein [Desulfovirgula thermocuniculi]|uniref:sigma-54 interaction domain-containing protein n=1 Tax=Desulfovirgula thermocuniculi TaxID=348842 RepID=UPI00040E380C|nr:sigma 54-interacting transcriptional regulator [Desulfovirgula thermocuniculi]
MRRAMGCPIDSRLATCLLDNPHEAAIFVDAEGIIRFINQAYCDFLGEKREKLLGRHIKEVMPQSRLLEVMQCGQPQFGEIWEIKGRQVVVQRLPIYDGDRVIGCLGRSVFKDDLSLVKEFMARIRQLKLELDQYRQELQKAQQAKYTIEHIVGNSQLMQSLKSKILRVARTNSTVLITGESGTGKELVAHAIHSASSRRHRPFIRVNCTCIPAELLESELFGYEEGAFTGARRGGKLGKFELAQGGTIFLDEIGDMDRSMQAKLLRVLQEKEIERVGGTRPITVDVRVIAATNRNLEELTSRGIFREDLYYRLNVVLINTPPLRAHKEDIPLLVDHIIDRLNRSLGTAVKGVTPRVLELFRQYDWPGNVREMVNMIEQAINLCEGEVLDAEDFPVLLKRLHFKQARGSFPGRTFAEAMAEAEKNILLQALSLAQNNKQEAARMLKIHRSVLYRKLKKHRLL